MIRRYGRLIAEEKPLPDLILIDGGKGHLSTGLQVLRDLSLEDKVDLSPFDVLIDSINPAGQITPSLIDSIDAALHNDQTTCIEVEGEEDLAPIIIHLLAPLGTNVIYGQPGKGVVLRITEFDAKEHCRRILSRFEVIN